MPLRARAERVGALTDRVGSIIDSAVAEHIVNGTPLPAEATFLSVLEQIIHVGAEDVLDEVDDETPDPLLVALVVAGIMDEVRTVVRSAFRAATFRRRQVEREQTEAATAVDDSDRRSGVRGVVFGVLVARRVATAVRPKELQRLAARTGQPMPARSGPRIRMIVRTGLAKSRNEHAATLAEGAGKVLLITDARYGDTDEACERVNGRYATVRWVRRHPVEHPNCTRLAFPVLLPDGARVTLLA